MNTDTGRIYELGEDFAALLPQPHAEALRRLRAVRDLTHDELAALADLAAGDTVVSVGERVAQKIRIAERELNRRQRRRRAERAAPPRHHPADG